MKKYTSIGLSISLVYCIVLTPLFAASLSGKIDAPSRVKTLIIYLSPAHITIDKSELVEHHISQKNTQFSEPLLIIKSGDAIQWTNNEIKEIDHNIFSLSPLNRFDLGLGAKGSQLSQIFNKTGVLNYYCSVHKEMEGKVVILPSRYYQFLERADDFKIDNIPAGIWTVNAIVFHRRYKVEPVKITIDENNINNLNLQVIKR